MLYKIQPDFLLLKKEGDILLDHPSKDIMIITAYVHTKAMWNGGFSTKRNWVRLKKTWQDPTQSFHLDDS